jgi:hypothetical protein
MRRLAIRDDTGLQTCAMPPSGLRTATAQLDGLRIITPSSTAWPPIAALIPVSEVYCLPARSSRRWKRSTRPPESTSFCFPV